MNRQQAFEAIYAKQHDVPAESLVQYRFESKDGYSLPGIASHYRTYCDALDSIVIKVEWPDHYEFTNPDVAGAAILDCRSAFQKSIKAAGVKYK